MPAIKQCSPAQTRRDGYLSACFRVGLFALSAHVFAVDGVVEINHTCAQNTGCFTGDTPNYPVQIDARAGHSYRLTSDLVLPNGNVSGISVTATDVTIDLNGFRIVTAACEAATSSSCIPSDATVGDAVTASTTSHNLTVRNGKIVGMGRSAVSTLASGATVENLDVRWTRLDGVRLDDRATVRNCTFFESPTTANTSAISIQGARATVANNNISNSAGRGILTQQSSVITDNLSQGAASSGIVANGGGSLVTGNIVRSNGGTGIQSAFGTLILANSVTLNGGIGINVTSHSTLVADNVISQNGDTALNFSGTGAYRDNIILTPNAAVMTVNGGVDAGGNVCNGATSCP